MASMGCVYTPPHICVQSNTISSDVDYEYPSNSAQGQGFADLLTETRKALDSLASRKGDSTPYLLTAAVSAGAENYANLKVPQMNAALDFWNLMASLRES
jgi:chitinase